ncbi:MAG: DUF2237 domain-containing protein [Gammaproteobacteria bacterium]|jgi:uncharacterized protein
MKQQFNVLGQPLQTCSLSPKTGFYRDGSCHTGENDHGSHTVCAIVNEEFLAYSKSKGNDLVTPVPEFDFPGLKPGDKWCVCALRWKEAFEADAAPPVSLMATHQNVLKFLELDDLLQLAVDLPKNA